MTTLNQGALVSCMYTRTGCEHDTIAVIEECKPFDYEELDNEDDVLMGGPLDAPPFIAAGSTVADYAFMYSSHCRRG